MLGLYVVNSFAYLAVCRGAIDQSKYFIMSNLDFIPENVQMDEKRIEQVCRAFLNTQRRVYDGKNYYAPKCGVCCNDGKYYFSNSDTKHLLFYPTTEELRTALAEFKKKGYYPYYDNDVCEYGYVKDMSQIRGKAVIAHIVWL